MADLSAHILKTNLNTYKVNDNLIIKEEASADIKDAFIYYEEQVAGLGLRFIHELDIHFNRIQTNPLNYSFFSDQKQFRSHNLEHFPFSIIYEVHENNVTVLQYTTNIKIKYILRQQRHVISLFFSTI